MSLLDLLSLVNFLPLPPEFKETGVSSMVCHSGPSKWRLRKLCSEVFWGWHLPKAEPCRRRARAAPSACGHLTESLQPASPRQPRLLQKLRQTVYRHLPRPLVSPAAPRPPSPPSDGRFSCQPSAGRPSRPALHGCPRGTRPHRHPVRGGGGPRRWEPASEEVMEAEGGGRAAAGKRGRRALGSSPAAWPPPPPPRRPLSRLFPSRRLLRAAAPLASPPSCSCPHAGPAARPQRLDGGAWLTHRPPGLSGGAAGASPRLL